MKNGGRSKAPALALIALAIVVGAVGVMVVLRESDTATVPPPSLADLDEVSKRLGSAVEARVRTADASDVPVSEGARKQHSVLPSWLESAVPPGILTARFREKRPRQILQTRIVAAAFKVIESGMSFVSEEQAAGWAWERGQELMRLGEWDAARRCFWEALDAPLDPRILRFACAKLGWLEDGPEKELRYLELSCQGDEYGNWLSNAVQVCRASGSDALAEYYQARLDVREAELRTRLNVIRANREAELE